LEDEEGARDGKKWLGTVRRSSGVETEGGKRASLGQGDGETGRQGESEK